MPQVFRTPRSLYYPQRTIEDIPEGNPLGQRRYSPTLLDTQCYNSGMKDFLHCTQSVLGGILALSLYGGVFFVVHELFRPSTNSLPITESIRGGLIDALTRKDIEIL